MSGQTWKGWFKLYFLVHACLFVVQTVAMLSLAVVARDPEAWLKEHIAEWRAGAELSASWHHHS